MEKAVRQWRRHEAETAIDSTTADTAVDIATAAATNVHGGTSCLAGYVTMLTQFGVLQAGSNKITTVHSRGISEFLPMNGHAAATARWKDMQFCLDSFKSYRACIGVVHGMQRQQGLPSVGLYE